MFVHEERRILRYLRDHRSCQFSQMLTACLPGTPALDGQRLLLNLEWLGYITVFPDQEGNPLLIQITTRGDRASA